jgi:hypothetical protein
MRGPDGRKDTHTDPLKTVVKKWATAQESKFQPTLVTYLPISVAYCDHGDVRRGWCHVAIRR